MKRMTMIAALAFLCLPGQSDAQKAPKKGPNSVATVSVKDIIVLELEIRRGPVEIVRGKTGRVEATLRDGSGRTVSLVQEGRSVNVLIDGDEEFDKADLLITVPQDSHIEIESVAGDVTVKNISGPIEIEAVSGQVRLSGCSSAEVETVSGSVVADAHTGPVSVETVSGDVNIVSKNSLRAEVESVSGAVNISGVCGAGCELEIESFSGEVTLKLDSKKSSFELEFESFSGRLQDKLGMTKLEQDGSPGRGMEFQGEF